jgi:DNA polymerase III sliding clamp (beta) subunit (PCNA family)
MDVTVQANDLAQAIAAARVVQDRPEEHIFLLADDGRLAVAQTPRFTVLPLALVHVPAEGELPEAPIALPGKLLREYVATLSGPCRLRLDGATVRVESGRAQATFQTLRSGELRFPQVEEELARLSAEEVQRARIVAAAHAREEIRPGLTVAWLIGNRLWATDGYRLATTTVQVEVEKPVPILPSLITVAAARGDEMIVSRGSDGYCYSSGPVRLLGWPASAYGSPPDYLGIWERMTAAETTASALVSTAAARKILRGHTQDSRAYLYISNGSLRLVLQHEGAQGEGTLISDLEATGVSGSGRRALNPRFLLDAVTDSAAVNIRFVGDDNAPVLITGTVDWLVMPIAVYGDTWPGEPDGEWGGNDDARAAVRR